MTRHFLITILSIFALALTVQGQSVDYKGAPWVKRTSRPYSIPQGLDGRHISLWSSHGRYFDAKKNSWQWQRPNLFCTTEDLLSQSFVNPYLIPMLERAGAVVFTPKERDIQANEAIVDNDSPDYNGQYVEQGKWSTCGAGFNSNFGIINDTIAPFRLGSVRSTVANKGGEATWTPEIPQAGHYAVYVSYSTLPSSIDDAHYTVHHAGGETTFSVNQQMGGGTWVYLGTFYFEAGQSPRGRVVLTSDSHLKGDSPNGSPYTVTADAVRFGGGRSRVERSLPDVAQTFTQKMVRQIIEGQPVDVIVTDTISRYTYGKGETAGLPRFLEGARYVTQLAGLADTLYNHGCGFNDYNDDIRSRSHMLNYLGGGSVFMPDTIGMRVPFELQFALHTDAGYHKNDDIYGTLAIATKYDDYGCTVYRSGLTRDASVNLASSMLKNVAGDLSALYNVKWPERDLFLRNYAETRQPLVPSTILELLSHQNYRDMTFAHDPNFKFDVSRSIYKVLMRQLYNNHGFPPPTIQPLPVLGFGAQIDEPIVLSGSHGKATVRLSWEPTVDPLEPTAAPTNYIVYVRQAGEDWDEGTLTNGRTSVKVALKAGMHHQFRVAALNSGGESLPSQTLSIYIAPTKANTQASTILIVDAFDRLSGPARRFTADEEGFDLNVDAGVSYGPNTSLCGEQTVFTRSQGGKEGSGALGFSTSEYVGVPLAGNNLDNATFHASDLIAVCPGVNVISTSRAAFDRLPTESLTLYDAIDYVAGLQADKSYNLKHYDVFTPQTRKLLSHYSLHGGRLFVSGAFLGERGASATDVLFEADSLFLAQTLHSTRRATLNHRERSAFSGLGISLPVVTRPSAAHYPVQESTVLEAVGQGAFSAFSYSSSPVEAGYSAGVAWPQGVVMGFPYECISDTKIRRSVMGAVIKHLFNLQK